MAKPKWNLIHKWNLVDFLESVSLCNSFNNEIIAYISIYSEKKKEKTNYTKHKVYLNGTTSCFTCVRK